MTREGASRRSLQQLIDRARFLRPYQFRVVSVAGDGACTLELPHRKVLERPGGIVNGPSLMAAADCAMWLAIKGRFGIDYDALTSELNTAFLAPAMGGHVYCTARILKAGRRRIYGTAQCHNRAGRLFTHHTVTYVRAD
jgi:acyl-coenzyme A thioesterase PaaI-like protein